MIPSNTGGKTNGCDPTSSNCVVWQGPNLDCIGLCTGDTVSTVIAKLAEKLCSVVADSCGECTIDLGTVDEKCIQVDPTTQNPLPPAANIQELLTRIINYVCYVEDILQECCQDTIISVPTVAGEIRSPYSPDNPFIRKISNSMYPHDAAKGLEAEKWIMVSLAASYDIIKQIKSLQNEEKGLNDRVKKLERESAKTLVLPKVISKCVSRPGTAVEMKTLLTALESAFCSLRTVVGSPSDVLKSIKFQPATLGTDSRLNGKGSMRDMAGWIVGANDIAGSLTNSWLTIADLRNAVLDLQKNTTPAAVTWMDDLNVKARFKMSGPSVSGIVLDFSDNANVIPSTFYDTDRGRGSKITIKDSSLNSVYKYVQISQNKANTAYSIDDLGSIDKTSNMEITIDIQLTDGDNFVGKSINISLTNKSIVPTVSTSAITKNSFQYTVSGINTTVGNTIKISTETPGGTLKDVAVYSAPSAIITGTVTGLDEGTSYKVFATVITKTGVETEGEKIQVTTTAPTCTAVHVTASTFKTALTDFKTGATKTVLSVYNDTVNNNQVVFGFDNSNNPIAYKGTADTYTAPSGTFVTYGTLVSKNPTTFITCNNVVYASGLSASNTGSGWEYVTASTSPNGITYYIYALVNKMTKTILEVVACCDCKALYLVDTDDDVYFVPTNQSRTISVNVAGATAGAAGTWTIVSLPTKGSASLSTTATSTEGIFNYTASSTDPWVSDSFSVKLTNDCGASNTITIPIQRATVLPYNDTDIVVMVDANSTSYADADKIKTTFESIKTQIQTICNTWTGTIYYVPVDRTTGANTSADYLNYGLAMVDKKGGASGSLTVATGATTWDLFKSEPPYWGAASTGPVPASTYIFAITNQGNTNGSYADASLSTGWGSQPSAQYDTDFDGVNDMLTLAGGGTAKSAWGSGKTHKYFNDAAGNLKFAQVNICQLTGSLNESAATALQMTGSIVGRKLTLSEFNGFKVGGIQYPIDLRNYILDGTAPVSVPYGTGTTAGGYSRDGIHKLNYIPTLFVESGYDWSAIAFNKLILSIMGLRSGSTGIGCTTTSPTAQNMISGSHKTFGTHATVCATACSNAASSTGLVELFNSTGTVFDTAVRAYSTLNGAILGGTTGGSDYDELTAGHWYCLRDGSGAGTRRVARYNASAPFWTEKTCATC